jgi:type I restriction enzyme M protein
MIKDILEYLELGVQRKLLDIKEDKISYIQHNKELILTPEEKVRAAVYVKLVHDYEYSPSCISLEFLVPRREPKDYADIVVFTDDGKNDNYIVVETKAPSVDIHRSIDQGIGYANNLRAKYLVMENFKDRLCFDIQNYPPNEREKNIINDIPKKYGKTPVYNIIRGSQCDLKAVDFNTLTSVFKRCHNILWSGGKNDPTTAFDEMSKLLFAKIKDETDTPNNVEYKFQIGLNENDVSVAKRVLEIYSQAKQSDPSVFNKNIEASDQQIFKVVDNLQGISMRDTDIDAKGQAFETFLGVIFRGTLGQYFTRRQIVDFVVKMLDPKEKDVIIDPACGSGGFLLHSMQHVFNQIETGYEGKPNLIARKQFDFCHNNIFGIDINEKISRVAMMDMIVNDDGHSNIENNTGLSMSFKNPRISQGSFTLIMTNPPFGVQIQSDDRDNLGDNSFSNFVFGNGKKSQLSDVLFLEQYKRLLCSDVSRNPRAGIVLSNGILNNPSFSNITNWIKRNFRILAVVSLPIYAFRKAGSGMKTCLLFLKKYSSEYSTLDNVPDYNVFLAIADHIGYDSTLRPDSNDFDSILEKYYKMEEDRDCKCIVKNLSELDYRLDPQYYYNMDMINAYFDELDNKGHKVLTLSQISSRPVSGKSPKGGVTYSSGEVPSITVSNLTQEGTFDFNDLNYVSEDFYNEFVQSKGDLLVNDILIAKDGATTGKTSILDMANPFLMPNEDGTMSIKAIYSEHIFKITIKPGIDAHYVNSFLNSTMGQFQLSTITSGGAQGGITSSFADFVRIPIIQKEAQKEISKSWESVMDEVVSLKNECAKKLQSLKDKTIDDIKTSEPASEDYIAELSK